MSRRSPYLWDRIADHPVGGRVVRYWLEGIDRNPTRFQTFAVRTGARTLAGAAHLADRILMSTSPWLTHNTRYVRQRTREDYSTPVGGGAGGGSAATAVGRYRAFRRAGHIKGATGPTLQLYRALRLPRGASDAAFIERQLALGLTQWCRTSASFQARMTASGPNKQVVQTFTCGKQHVILSNAVASDSVSSDFGSLRAFVDCAKRVDVGTIGEQTDNVLGVQTQAAAPAGGFTAIAPTPRMSWDLGTCWQLRDYVSYAYDMYDSTSVRTGYRYPYYLGDNTTVYAGGYPNVFDSAALAFPRLAGMGSSGASTRDVPTVTALVAAGYSVEYATQYREYLLRKSMPLYLDEESIEFNFYNPTEAVQTVDVYELVLKETIPIVGSNTGVPTAVQVLTALGGDGVAGAGQGLPVGVIPDPQKLWDSYIQFVDTKGHLTAVPDSAREQDAGVVDEELPFGVAFPIPAAPGSMARTSVAGNGSTIQFEAQERTAPSITTAGMRPMGTLLDQWYRVVRHRIQLEAGSRQGMRIVVSHKCRPSFQDFMYNYAVKGRSRTFMMVVKGERVLGTQATTPVAGAAATLRSPGDILCHWTKKAKFCRTTTKPDPKTLDLSAPLRTDLTVLRQVDAEEGDFEAV